MRHIRSWQRYALAMAIVTPIVVFAQSKAEDPRDPSAPIPVTPYQSAFSGYDAYQDAALIPWRKSNDDMWSAAKTTVIPNMGNMPKGMSATDGKPMETMHGHAMPKADGGPKAKE
jgi:hypothetical protein